MNPITLQNGNVCGHNCQNIDTWIAKAFLTAFWLTERDKEWELCRNPGKCSSARVTWLRAESRGEAAEVCGWPCAVFIILQELPLCSHQMTIIEGSCGQVWVFLAGPLFTLGCIVCRYLIHITSLLHTPHHQTFTLTLCHSLLAAANVTPRRL